VYPAPVLDRTEAAATRLVQRVHGVPPDRLHVPPPGVVVP
jgi:hypothetical protein